MRRLVPTTRFVADAGTADMSSQIGTIVDTVIERKKPDGGRRDYLTWRTAKGMVAWIGRRGFYLPLFFWRPLR